MQIRQMVSGLLVYAMCFGALAQPPAGEPSQDRFTRMQQQLNLTDEQVQRMRDIKANGGSREEIDAVLTDEQRAKMAQMRSQHKQGGQRAAGNFQRMKRELNLTDEQVSQMQDIRARGGSREEIDAVMTEEQRKQWQQLREQRRGKGQGKGTSAAAAPEAAAASTEK